MRTRMLARSHSAFMLTQETLFEISRLLLSCYSCIGTLLYLNLPQASGGWNMPARSDTIPFRISLEGLGWFRFEAYRGHS